MNNDINSGNSILPAEDLVNNVLQPAQNIIDLCISGIHLMVTPESTEKPPLMTTFPTADSLLQYIETQVATILAYMTTT